MSFEISDQTKQLIDNLVEYDVQRAYGHNSPEDQDAARGARMIALAAVMLDLHGQVEELHRDSAAHVELNARARAALDARRCQCPIISEGSVCRHGDYPAAASWTTKPRAVCSSYFELDVPEIDGAKLCGTCYIATADERGLPMAEA